MAIVANVDMVTATYPSIIESRDWELTVSKYGRAKTADDPTFDDGPWQFVFFSSLKT
jgi:hypothetical protein